MKRYMVNLQGLAQVLVMENLLDKHAAEQAMQSAKKQNQSFVNYLVDNQILHAKDIAYLGSRDFGVPLLDLDCYDRELIPIDLVSEKLIRLHHALPLFRRGNLLFIAVSDPSKQITLDEIKFHTGLTIRSVVVEADKLSKLIEEALSAKETAALDEYLGDSDLDEVSIETGEEHSNDQESHDNDDAPIVRFVNKILLDAINKGASDIHFEPYEATYRVRLRIDGILHEVAQPPINLGNRIASRIKVMSQLDISERRIPQDGRFKMNLTRKRAIDFRVSTCPTVGGEKVVMRILDPGAAKLGIESLGFFPEQQQQFLEAIQQPQGMILVTGPTGSGKTVTLYSALNLLNEPEKNISTAEDPVELKVNGINQVQINTKAGLSFSAALRSFLRQDPDIIMVGEMRDLETAEIGIKAAQTGHLVLSTLHTNSAPETLTRLVNMGVETYNIASSVNLIIAQRLARRLCTHCRQVDPVPEDVLQQEGLLQSGEMASDMTIYQAKGCDKCTNGYKGRVGLYEVMPVTKAIGEIIMRRGNSLEIAAQAAQDGLITIRESGFINVKKGITTLDEVYRVTKD